MQLYSFLRQPDWIERSLDNWESALLGVSMEAFTEKTRVLARQAGKMHPEFGKYHMGGKEGRRTEESMLARSLLLENF